MQRVQKFVCCIVALSAVAQLFASRSTSDDAANMTRGLIPESSGSDSGDAVVFQEARSSLSSSLDRGSASVVAPKGVEETAALLDAGVRTGSGRLSAPESGHGLGEDLDIRESDRVEEFKGADGRRAGVQGVRNPFERTSATILDQELEGSVSIVGTEKADDAELHVAGTSDPFTSTESDATEMTMSEEDKKTGNGEERPPLAEQEAVERFAAWRPEFGTVEHQQKRTIKGLIEMFPGMFAEEQSVTASSSEVSAEDDVGSTDAVGSSDGLWPTKITKGSQPAPQSANPHVSLLSKVLRNPSILWREIPPEMDRQLFHGSNRELIVRQFTRSVRSTQCAHFEDGFQFKFAMKDNWMFDTFADVADQLGRMPLLVQVSQGSEQRSLWIPLSAKVEFQPLTKQISLSCQLESLANEKYAAIQDDLSRLSRHGGFAADGRQPNMELVAKSIASQFFSSAENGGSDPNTTITVFGIHDKTLIRMDSKFMLISTWKRRVHDVTGRGKTMATSSLSSMRRFGASELKELTKDVRATSMSALATTTAGYCMTSGSYGQLSMLVVLFLLLIRFFRSSIMVRVLNYSQSRLPLPTRNPFRKSE